MISIQLEHEDDVITVLEATRILMECFLKEEIASGSVASDSVNELLCALVDACIDFLK